MVRPDAADDRVPIVLNAIVISGQEVPLLRNPPRPDKKSFH
jgi:hypothetical protein